MKKNRSASIPEKLPSVNKIITPRNQSTSRKEQFVSSSLKSPQVFRLTKENLELRGKLKDFNDKLNNLIISSKTKILKSPRQDLNPELDLKQITRNLEYYENEHKRIENRLKMLSDPAYEAKLKAEIEDLLQKVQKSSENVKKNEAKQKQREKILETVLDTGEKQELHKEFMELNTDIAIYAKRLANLEELNMKTAKRMKEIDENSKKFQEKFTKRNAMVDKKDDTLKKIIGESNEKLTRKFGVINGELESKKQASGIKIKKLTEELEKNKKVEQDLKKKLEEINTNLRKKKKILANLQERSSQSYRNVLNDDYVNDGLMFMTEQY